MHRRQLLAAVPVLGSAGCLRLTGDEDGVTQTATPSPTDAAVTPGADQGDRTPADDSDPDTTPIAELSVTASWPQFQRDATHTGTALDTTGPTTEPSVRWTSERDTGAVWTPPIVADGRVYTASHTDADNAAIHAFDAATGGFEWYQNLPGWSEFTPAVGAGTLFAATGGQAQLRAFDAASGDTQWFLPLGDTTLSVPTYHDGTVYVADADGRVHARAAADGSERWRTDLDGFIGAPPTVTDQGVYVTAATLEWTPEDEHDRNRAFMYYGEDPVEAAADAGGTTTVVRLDPDSGEERARTDLPALVSEAPTATRDTIYVGDWTGRLHALAADDLTDRWRTNVGDLIATTPTVDADRVYVGLYNEGIAAVGRGDGAPEWTFATTPGCHAAPVRVGDLLYVPTAWRQLYALLPGSGTARWDWALDEGEVNIAVVDGVAFVTNGSGGPVYALTAD